MRMTQTKLVEEFVTKPIYPRKAGRVKLCLHSPLLGCVPGRCDGVWYIAVSEDEPEQSSDDVPPTKTTKKPPPIMALRMGDLFIVNSAKKPASAYIYTLLKQQLSRVTAPIMFVDLDQGAELCWDIGLERMLYYIALRHLGAELSGEVPINRNCAVGAALQYLTDVPCFSQMVFSPAGQLLSTEERDRILDFWLNCFGLWLSMYTIWTVSLSRQWEPRLVPYFNTLFLCFHNLLDEASLRQSDTNLFGGYLWLYFFLVRLFPSLRYQISPNFGMEYLTVQTRDHSVEDLMQIIRIYNFQGITLKALQSERFLPFDEFCSM